MHICAHHLCVTRLTTPFVDGVCGDGVQVSFPQSAQRALVALFSLCAALDLSTYVGCQQGQMWSWSWWSLQFSLQGCLHL